MRKKPDVIYRLDLLTVMNSGKHPTHISREAEELYKSIGTGACDYETIHRFLLEHPPARGMRGTNETQR